jgi:RNA polymerase sigma factor (sigma-70 family)
MVADGPSDEAVLAAMAQGDEQAAVTFLRRYQNRVFGLARAMVSDSGMAEEIAQEAFVRVWRHAAVFDVRRGAVSTWVLAITKNLAIDALRVRRAVPVDPGEFLALGTMSTERSPEDVAIRAVVAPSVRDALRALPVDQQRALVLAAVYGRTAADIAQLEKIPLGTAKTRIRAAMSKLRVALVDQVALS